jgi:membrane protein DedA with SNARE-associated domain
MGVLEALIQYKYLLFSLLAVIEGPILSLASGFLIRLGYLSFWPVFALLLIGDIVSDTLYYFLAIKTHGERYVRRYGRRYKSISENFEFLKNLWKRHGAATMFFGKFAYGFTAPLIVSAALSKISYRKLIFYILPPTAIKYALLIAVGYYMAQSYQSVEKYIYLSALYVPLTILAFFYGYKLVLRYLKGKASRDSE